MVFNVFLLAAFVSLSAGFEVNVNKMADALIAAIDEDISDKGSGEVEIPIIGKRWGSGWLRGSFICLNGTLQSLATLKRTSDSSMIVQKGEPVVLLQIDLGLGTFEANYGQCQAKVFGQTIDHFNLEASVNKNSFYAQVSVAKLSHNKCSARLEVFEPVDFGKITIQTSGILSNIKNIILGELAKSMHGSIARKVKTILATALQNVVAQPEFCSMIYDV